MVRTLVGCACALAAGTAAVAQSEDHSGGEIVVTGERPNFADGPPRCRKAADDPLDSFTDFPSAGPQRHLRWDAATQTVTVHEDGPSDLPEYFDWQRDSTNFTAFLFRSRSADELFCIGSMGSGAVAGFAQLRKTYRPAHCEHIRFTAFIAPRRARVRVWINGGSKGTWNHAWVIGTKEWVPIHLQSGPIGPTSNWMGHGILQDGGGDVWIYDPQFRVLDHAELTERELASTKRCLERKRENERKKREAEALRRRLRSF